MYNMYDMYDMHNVFKRLYVEVNAMELAKEPDSYWEDIEVESKNYTSRTLFIIINIKNRHRSKKKKPEGIKWTWAFPAY